MISQNRADRKRQAIADQQWQTVKDENRQNEELLASRVRSSTLLRSRTPDARDPHGTRPDGETPG
jgi:hypothetical protein